MNLPRQDEAPLYAKLGEPIEEDMLGVLLRRTRGMSARKLSMFRKYRVWREDTRDLVLDAIFTRQNDDSTRREMAKFITGVRNDALDITRDSAVVWKHGANRSLRGRTSKKVRNAIADLERETMIDTLAPSINQLGFLQGPQITVPVVRGGRLNLDNLPAHLHEPVFNIDDPCGEPAAVAWTESYAQDGRPARTIVLDSQTLRHFEWTGDRPVEDVDARITHGGGYCPCATFRIRPPLLGDDWHDVTLNQRLVEGTVEILIVLTALAFVRKTQCKRLLTMVGKTEGLPKGQVIGPERPIVAKTSGGKAGLDIDAIDFDTPPDSFLKHALFLAHSMAEPFGGRVESASGEPLEFAKIVIPYESQTELRHAQIPHAIVYEQHLWAAAVTMMNAQGHRHAEALPDAREMEERIQSEYGTLSRTIADPNMASAQDDHDLKHGLTSEYRLMANRLGPGSNLDDARRRVREHLDERAEFNDAVTTRDLNMGGKVQTAPQAFGALGTPAREANRADAQHEDTGPRPGQGDPPE